MTPEDFIAKWRNSELKEKQAAQSHFNDLCALLEVPNPAEEDQKGTSYAFEKAVKKPDGSQGYADVWRKDCFAWEYKGDLKNLVKAYTQIKEYADALDNPPLLIVSDMKEIRVHTNFTSTVKEEVVIPIIDLHIPEVRQRLRRAWTNPDSWRPTKTHEAVTKDAAAAFAAIAQKLRGRGHDPRVVAHFLNKIVFCLFAEDIELLPDRVFADIVEESVKNVNNFEPLLHSLFRAMRDNNGFFGTTAIPWFNGGLFDDNEVLPLRALDLPELAAACRLDWGAINPYIFGTLFEKGLDPERRKEMASLFDPKAATPEPAPGLFTKQKDKAVGVHYTDPDTIKKIIDPVILWPWQREWDETKAHIAALRERKAEAKGSAAKTKIENEIRALYLAFREHLGKFRVLDPACGSGNFLYLALTALKDFDRDSEKEARDLGLPADNPRVGPECVRGIEVNPYAAELARVTVWIGEIQWQMKNGGGVNRRPILGKLDGIVNKDALVGQDKHEASWPEADVVIGNPPFVGNKTMIRKLGEDYVNILRAAYDGRVSAGADLVCYWFEKARAKIECGELKRAGLVSTNSIRGGENRQVLSRINETGMIFDAWSDEAWVVDGAAVRVSLTCFSNKNEHYQSKLNGRNVNEIFSDLTASNTDTTKATPLTSNKTISFQGPVLVGPFEVSSKLAQEWLMLPKNPDGKSNAEVLRPLSNGKDITSRSRGLWVIDFYRMPETEACLFEAPFEYARKIIKPVRDKNAELWRRQNWWLHGRTGDDFRKATKDLTRYLATSQVSKHRFFVWLHPKVQPHQTVIAIARDDYTSFGILNSHIHEAWALQLGTWLGVGNDPRYTPSTTFETFPFPEGLTPNIPAKDYTNDPRAQKIADAAQRLNDLREAWLNPPDLIRIEPEVLPGYPDRILPKNDKAAAELKKRTLTNLYNQRPTWLANAHKALDEAVAAAYGWPADLPDDEVLARLFALNQARAAAQEAAAKPAKAKAEKAEAEAKPKAAKAAPKTKTKKP
ncbi:MAG: class I SAM-dependent DNA methyltransferase [Alphaproteobacteria bacterium]